jgi:hypothetical protein
VTQDTPNNLAEQHRRGAFALFFQCHYQC